MTWEIDVVLWLQSFTWLFLPMAVVSAIGSPAFYLGLMAVLAWWRDARFSFRLGVLLAVTAVTNDIAKLLVHAPRPYWVSSSVLPLELQNSFGLPSGHAELAVALLGLVALRLRRPLATVALGALAFLIGLSRIVRGAHFPLDVLAGFLLGFVVLGAFLLVEPIVARSAARLRPRTRIMIALILSLAAVATSGAVAGTDGLWSPDPAWTGEVADLAPVSIEFTLIGAGLALGLVIGREFERAPRPFRSLAGGLAGTLVGLAVLALLWFGVGLALPGAGLEAAAGAYLRSVAIGVWALAGAPAVFAYLGLLGPGPRNPHHAWETTG
ncbi:MAG: phosphatase PAP2 family protein [Methanospirillum sp.]